MRIVRRVLYNFYTSNIELVERGVTWEKEVWAMVVGIEMIIDDCSGRNEHDMSLELPNHERSKLM